MGSSASQSASASPEFLAVFRAHADAGGSMTFARFMELALYHPQLGYYRRAQPRVGYGAGTDFYTASTSGPVFGELVAAACAKRLRDAGRDPAAHTFVEIGAENPAGILAGVAHPFAGARTLRVGETLALSGDCVVFSNELFDAQPCVRTVFHDGCWRELGVREQDGQLVETALGTFADPLPAPEGYHFDRPIAAAQLADQLTSQSWRGLFVAFDYGKTLLQLRTETPAGTARAYHRHTQSNDLLAHAGEQDLTCHVCWDWLEASLTHHGFVSLALDSQEAFFIRQAGEYIAAASAADAAHLTKRKLALLQLLHPGQMDQKFQVLHALR